MVVTEYDGYETMTRGGRVLSKYERGEILLALDGPHFEGSMMMSLTPDQAFQVALGLMRDVSLARFGSG